MYIYIHTYPLIFSALCASISIQPEVPGGMGKLKSGYGDTVCQVLHSLLSKAAGLDAAAFSLHICSVKLEVSWNKSLHLSSSNLGKKSNNSFKHEEPRRLGSVYLNHLVGRRFLRHGSTHHEEQGLEVRCFSAWRSGTALCDLHCWHRCFDEHDDAYC